MNVMTRLPLAVAALFSILSSGVVYADRNCDPYRPDPRCRPERPRPELRLGSRIIDRHDYEGRVDGIFANGQVLVSFVDGGNGHQEYRASTELFVEARCVQGFCKGDGIRDRWSYTGIVDSVYVNGRAKILYHDGGTGHHEFKSLLDLAVTAHASPRPQPGCAFNICVGQAIIDRSNFLGTVVEVYANGQGKIRFIDGGSGHDEIRNMAELSGSVPSFGGICVRDLIFDRNGYTGQVKVVFSNGRVIVRFDDGGSGHEEIRTTSELRVRGR